MHIWFEAWFECGLKTNIVGFEFDPRSGVQQCQAQGLVFCPWLGSS